MISAVVNMIMTNDNIHSYEDENLEVPRKAAQWPIDVPGTKRE